LCRGLFRGLFGLICGMWFPGFVGPLDGDAPAGETVGVGLTSGLLVLAAWWATGASGGRSSFTPVAIGFAAAIGLAALQRRQSAAQASRNDPTQEDGPATFRSARRRDLVVAVGGCAIFVVAVALVYGSTLIESPRDGVQP